MAEVGAAPGSTKSISNNTSGNGSVGSEKPNMQNLRPGKLTLNPEAEPFVPPARVPPTSQSTSAGSALPRTPPANPQPKRFGPAVKWLGSCSAGQVYAPPPVTGTTVFAISHTQTVYVTGGWMAGGEWLSSVHAFHTMSRAWRPVIVLQQPPRSFHGSAIVPHITPTQSLVYVFGGAAMGQYSSAMYTISLRSARALRFSVTCGRTLVITALLLQCFSDYFGVPVQSVVVLTPYHTTESAPTTPPAGNVPPTNVNRTVVVLDPQANRSAFLARPFIPGPWKAAGCFAISELEETPIDVAEWSAPIATAGAMPPPRTGGQGAVIGTQLYLFGGRSPAEFLNDLHVLDLSTLAWRNCSASGHAPPPHPYNALVTNGHRLVVVCRQHGTMFAFDTRSSAWKRIADVGYSPHPKCTEVSRHNSESYNADVAGGL
eukprot:TRINITY_DN1815_c0_g1_i2.p1 TRINITY_DN1815_c0_g1~~TRINITY_DN1815_c0_g1_i2.p1  ORF type:complete len:430 (-),score=37.89 TRINITY_DN1815_c0_g1_i2:502-1791(-)